MSCAITSGYTLDCKDAIGGIKKVASPSLDDATAVSFFVKRPAMNRPVLCVSLI